ncbi:MAG TPA: hypothetical protein VMU14_00810, partial [Acidimicrobiales bacterium]|nr:hypothetical protein [Acidimicrobiales bacterium]
MTHRYLMWGTSVLVVGAVSLLRGCDCGGTPTGGGDHTWQCAAAGRPGEGVAACPAGQHFAFGQCGPERCDAAGSPGYCPGTVCNAGGACVVPASRVQVCLGDADCAAGLTCLDRPRVKAGAKTCGFVPVDAEGACASGQPFAGRCVEAVPCGGGCGAGQVCNIDLDLCELPGVTASAASCGVTCDAGELLVYTDPDLMLFDQCCAVECACLPLPGVPEGVWGRYDDLAVAGGVAYTSAHDSTYGDLVVGRWDAAGPTLSAVDWVDGVPADAPVVASPSGPRQGRDAAGPDVGLHGSMVLAGGEPAVAYYDATGGHLKLARHDPAAGWITSLVDDGRDPAGGVGGGDVGRYTSLAVDGAGRLHVTYYVHRATRAGMLVTGVMYARSRTPAPGGYDDWDHVTVELVPSCGEACDPTSESCVLRDGAPAYVTPSAGCAASCDCDERCVDGPAGATCATTLPWSLMPACGGACGTGATCVWQPGIGTSCEAVHVTCAPACATGEACVDDGSGGGVCRTSVATSSVRGIPDGTGLFTSLALVGGTPVVAHYDRLRAQARGATGAAAPDTLAFSVAPLACADGQ